MGRINTVLDIIEEENKARREIAIVVSAEESYRQS
jgi:aspartokinase